MLRRGQALTAGARGLDRGQSNYVMTNYNLGR